MENHKKINLIYIASIGHSGSTLLESILGTHSEITTCGEIHMWPHEVAQGGVKPCVCGQSILECPIWVEMYQQVDLLQQAHPQIHFFREQWNAGHTLRLSRIREFSKKTISPSVAEQVNVYGQNNYIVFDSFLKIMRERYNSQLTWVVDASKDPYRLLWLARSNFFNVKVLHVVKSPPSFAYSMVKRLPKDEINSFRKRFTETARQSLKWSIENHLISQVAQNHLAPSDYMLVNYEKLASKPTEMFKEICTVIGCEFESGAVSNFREESQHTIAGNPMRYESKGIVLDEKWKTSFSDPLKTVSAMLTSMNRSRYGY